MDHSSRPKQAACLVCRRSKVKCDWPPGQSKCKRCLQQSTECIRPEFHAGRQKGIKNKRKGLEKALYQIEQAIKRRKTGEQSSEDQRAIIGLQTLLENATNRQLSAAKNGRQQSFTSHENGDPGDDSSSEEDSEPGNTPKTNAFASLHRSTEETLAVDDAENPLQLLARASNLHLSPISSGGPSPGQSSSTGAPISRRAAPNPSEKTSDIESFFTSIRVNLDISDEIDPISMGLVTDEEADSLFSFFHKNLAHTRWGLDPVLYTMHFTRSRSAFLFTSIMAASALFMPSAVAISKRLSNHCKTLANRVMVQRHKSVEIVLAFMVNVPWMFPGQHSTDDETCWYVAMATTIAIDLSLHKVVVATEMLVPGATPGLPRGDCVDPQTAMALDGFGDVDPSSELGQRLLRRRERCWIALFVLERGMSLARGRIYTVPLTRSLRDCDRWHASPIADPMDGHLVSMAVLRRDLDGLFSTVRGLCDGSQRYSTDGSLIAQSIQSAIEKFFDQWYAEWGLSIGTGPQHRLPPYVEILVTHTRLSTYGGVINHPTAPLEVRRFFRTAGLSSALNVMRAAIQGESQLQSMPNNTAIMISFAACFALSLSAYTTGTSNLAPSVRNLIEETADVLERVGSTTGHRNGMSALYGKYLRRIVRKAAAVTDGQTRANTQPAAVLHHSTQYPAPVTLAALAAVEPMVTQAPYMEPQIWSGTLQFSTMSDDQIVEALNQAGNELDPSFGGLSWEDMTNFDWLNWPNLSEFGF